VLRDVEAQRVTRELPLLGAELGLLDVATARGVEHLEAAPLAQDHTIPLADVLDLQVGAEQVLEGELVVEDRLQVGRDLAVEVGVVPALLGGLVQVLLGAFVGLDSLLGATPGVHGRPGPGERLDCRRGHDRVTPFSG
jgi:hypothetical protein